MFFSVVGTFAMQSVQCGSTTHTRQLVRLHPSEQCWGAGYLRRGSKDEIGETWTPSLNSLHPDIAHSVAGAQVETGETWTSDANSLHPDIAHLVAAA